MSEHHQFPRQTPIAFSLALLLLPLAPERALAESDVNMQAITAAWKARQKRVRTLRFEWKGQQTYGKGSIMNPTFPKAVNPDGRTIPTEDTSYDLVKTLLFDRDGNKLRYESKGYEDYICSFDGKDCKYFNPVGSIPYPKGVIARQDYNPEVKNVNTRPVLFTYRALDPKMDLFNPGDFAVTKPRGLMRGRTCVVLKEVAKASTQRVRWLWVDPERDFTVLRYAAGPHGKIDLQIDIDYSRDSEHGWTPSAWTIVWLMQPEGPLKESFKANVTSYAINSPVRPEEFHVSFPPDTWVHDQKRKSELGEFTDFILRADNRERIVTAADFGATYEQLINSESGMAFAAPCMALVEVVRLDCSRPGSIDCWSHPLEGSQGKTDHCLTRLSPQPQAYQ